MLFFRCWSLRFWKPSSYNGNHKKKNRKVPRWPDYEQNSAQITYWRKKWREPIRRVNPRRIEASWYVADRVRIRVDWPHDFDCRKSPMRNRIRSVENLAARNSEITDRLPYHQYVTVSVICNSWNLFNGDCRQLKPSGWPDNPRGWVDGLQTTATSLFQVRFSQARHLRLDKK